MRKAPCKELWGASAEYLAVWSLPKQAKAGPVSVAGAEANAAEEKSTKGGAAAGTKAKRPAGTGEAEAGAEARTAAGGGTSGGQGPAWASKARWLLPKQAEAEPVGMAGAGADAAANAGTEARRPAGTGEAKAGAAAGAAARAGATAGAEARRPAGTGDAKAGAAAGAEARGEIGSSGPRARQMQGRSPGGL